MKLSLEIDAVSVIVYGLEFRILRLVYFTNLYGKSISKHIVVIISWEYEECFSDLKNSSLGKFNKITPISPMMQYFTLPHSFRAEPSSSEQFRVFPSVSDHISTKFRVFPSGS